MDRGCFIVYCLAWGIALAGCSDSSFTGQADSKKEVQAPSESAASPDLQRDPVRLPAENERPADSEGSGEDEKPVEDNNGIVQIPSDAVAQGSFAAWTVPSDPRPLEPYSIIISIKMPGDGSSFSLSQLRGWIKGTDGFTEGIGRDHTSYQLGGGWGQQVWTSPGYARLSILIPGGDWLVEDTIYVRSEQLGEEATLTLRF